MAKKTAKKTAIIYSTPTCPYCFALKDWLKENKIGYKDYDVSKDQKKADEMVEKSGQMGVPVIDIEGTIIVGFDKEALKKKLKIK